MRVKILVALFSTTIGMLAGRVEDTVDQSFPGYGLLAGVAVVAVAVCIAWPQLWRFIWDDY